MKKNLYTFLLLLVTLFPAATVSAQSPTAPALNFNVFLESGARLINNETEGPVAMGGDLTVDGGYQVSTNHPGDFYVNNARVTLVVGGKVIYSSGGLQVNQGGYVKIGNCLGSTMWYTDPHGAYPPMRITPTSDYNSSPRINLQVASNSIGVSAGVNPICQAGVIDFASAFVMLRAYSDTMSHLTDNAMVTNSGGTPIPHTGLPPQIKVTMNPGLNVLNVTGADLSNVTDFIYNNTPDASRYFIINVNAPGAFSWSVGNSGGIGISQCPYILYNFYNTTALTIAGYGAIEGTVFAPYATIYKASNMANIEGQVIGKSFHHGGGENHYAVFTPTIPGCGGATVPHASFGVNNYHQCLDCNSFVFTNTSTGTAPLTYLWSFGDGSTSTVTSPGKIYTLTGTFNVKLKVTGPGGADSVTHSIQVSGAPPHGFTVNDSVQHLDGNNFAFTSTTPTFGNLYYWTFGDGTTSTLSNPSKPYDTVGVYTVIQRVTGGGGCVIETTMNVVVECDSVGGGGGGGLESESLGDLVSKREYNKIKKSISKYVDYSTLPVFSKPSPFAAAKTSEVSGSLKRFVPEILDAGSVTRITTPKDITTITSAVDVFSVDYTRNDIAKAVVLGITTTGKPYNHTKSICDRFRGAKLIDTREVMISGFRFIQFALKQENGQVEHAIAFAAGKSASGATYKLQSKWLISEYSPSDSIFNFQVWSTSPDNTQKLAKDILNNLASIMPLEQTDVNFTLPTAYIAQGLRNMQYIDVAITSKVASNNAKLIFIEKINEVAGEDSLIIPFNIAAGTENHFSIPIYDGYEYEGHFYLNDTLVDDVYMADGNWSLDYDKTNTEVLTYKPDNNFNRVYNPEEYPIYRSVRVNANTHDYISMYKFIKAGQEKVDLSNYHSYKFFASGEGKMEVILIKESVVNFADQYRTNIKLEPNGKNYQISFDDFVSAGNTAPLDARDIKAIVYNYSAYGVATDFHFFADEQSFSKVAVQSMNQLMSKQVSVFPNPTSGAFQLKFASEEDRDMDVTLTDISGRLVYKQSLHAIMGFNTVNIQFPSSVAQSVLLLQLGNKNVKYSVTKVSILK